MNLRDSLRLTLRHLRQRGLRSWLTILGIVIGVAAVVSIVSIGEGLRVSVTERLQRLGGDVISITPGFTQATGMMRGPPGFMGGSATSATLTDTDLAITRSTPGVQAAAGAISGRARVYYLGQNVSLSLQGVDPAVWRLLTTTQVESGRMLAPGDTHTALLGSRVAQRVFKQPLAVNRQVTIDNQTYRVVGVLQATDFGRDDNSIILPLPQARTHTPGLGSTEYNTITAKATPGQDVEALAADIQSRLMVTRHVSERTQDFTVTSPAATAAVAQQITGTITLFLAGIAAVSLLVGAVGISNTMYMSVLERTREIGLLKALGATNGEVLRLFVAESALFGLVGGTIGAAMGAIAAIVMGTVGLRIFPGPGGGGGAVVIPPMLLPLAMGFAMLIGALSGVFPARQAARLKPVEALRYE
ncbi:MAG: ABC transporter permease [Euryarchaeota archaeon]|nr:ABC transporter permease [Euryarchaeota archaeon]